MVEAQTAARKILFEDISIVPKVNSNPPSPEPESHYEASEVLEYPRIREEGKRRESEQIRPQKKQSKAMAQFL